MSGTPAQSQPVAKLPHGIRACLFDLDGVLTQTAKVHAAAWKEMFDAYLRERSAQTGEPFVPFDITNDYALYVDGKLRQDGVRSFLASRQIVLPEGTFDDPPTAETVHGLGTRKNDLVQTIIRRDGVDTYPGSVRFLAAVRADGHKTAVVSASRNCQAVLAATGLEAMFDVRIDGVVAAARNLPGKPAPDTFLAAAAELGVEPAAAAVFEDAVAGVAAGRAGNFGWVVGVDRVGHAQALRDNGADIVVADLSDLLEEQ
jgi:beta-phosphoglucomutase family hydrolase